MQGIPIRILTIVLFATGGVIAAIAIFQQFAIASNPTTESKLFAVSKEEAITMALKEVEREPNRDASILPHENAKATFIHIGKGGWSFIIDEDSLDDMWAFKKDDRFEKYEDKYVWYVEVTTSNINGGIRGYWYLIDADSGQAIGKGPGTI